MTRMPFFPAGATGATGVTGVTPAPGVTRVAGATGAARRTDIPRSARLAVDSRATAVAFPAVDSSLFRTCRLPGASRARTRRG